MSESAYLKLKSYNWPGNIRELENTIHRSVLISQTQEMQDGDIDLTSQEQVEDLHTIERKAIQNALHRYNRNHELAAKVLGISIQYLEDKLSQYNKS